METDKNIPGVQKKRDILLKWGNSSEDAVINDTWPTYYTTGTLFTATFKKFSVLLLNETNGVVAGF